MCIPLFPPFVKYSLPISSSLTWSFELYMYLAKSTSYEAQRILIIYEYFSLFLTYSSRILCSSYILKYLFIMLAGYAHRWCPVVTKTKEEKPFILKLLHLIDWVFSRIKRRGKQKEMNANNGACRDMWRNCLALYEYSKLLFLAVLCSMFTN
jgi:hypothetical protein